MPKIPGVTASNDGNFTIVNLDRAVIGYGFRQSCVQGGPSQMLIQPVEHIQIDTIIAYYSEKCLFKSEVIVELIWECAINEILEFQSTFISRNRA